MVPIRPRALPLPRLPGDVGHSGVSVGSTCEDEEKIAQSVQVNDEVGARRRVVDHQERPLCPPAYRAGVVERRGLLASPRQEERPEGRKLRFGSVDGLLQARDVWRSEKRHPELHLLARDAGKLGAEREEVYLRASE